MLTLKINYLVIGNVRDAATGIIKEIHSEIDTPGNGPGEHVMLTTDTINENTP